MNPNRYQKLASRTMNPAAHIGSSGNSSLACYALGIAGEAGEVADYLKKYLFHGHDLDNEKLVKEIGDVLWYAAALLTMINVPMETCMEINIEKLNKRYPSGFNESDSINRKDQ